MSIFQENYWPENYWLENYWTGIGIEIVYNDISTESFKKNKNLTTFLKLGRLSFKKYHMDSRDKKLQFYRRNK